MTIVTSSQYRALAELRYRIRQFLQSGDEAARAARLKPQQYLVLLAIRGLPPGEQATIKTLAQRLALKHHSAVELVDRLERRGLVRRTRDASDRRQVLVVLQPRGRRLLYKVAKQRIGELRATGAALISALNSVVRQKVGRSRL